jgi:hypothetical protein
VNRHEPSVSSLADALSRTTVPQTPPKPRIAIAKPTTLMRVLFAAALLLGLGFLAALLVLGMRVNDLVVEMRADRQADLRQTHEALPPEEILGDAEATRREAKARPLAAGPIWKARCALLAKAGDWAAIVATCMQVGLTQPGDLLAGTRLLQAEALHRLGRQAEAARVLYAIDQTGYADDERAHAADLAGRLWLSVEGPAKQSGETAPERTDQLDAR